MGAGVSEKQVVIWKLQRPLASSDQAHPWLMYSRGRKAEGVIPDVEIDNDVRAMMGDDYKIYVEGTIGKDGKVSIIRRVADQDW